MDVVIHLLRLDFIPADWWNIVFRWVSVVAISFQARVANRIANPSAFMAR